MRTNRGVETFMKAVTRKRILKAHEEDYHGGGF
jgi:hypothetical protein